MNRYKFSLLAVCSLTWMMSACGGSPGHEGDSPASSQAMPVTAASSTREWVVSPTGNDASAGTAAAPLRTISRAISLAKPGNLIRVLAGTYAERLLINGSVQAGTPTQPITLVGEGKPHIILGSQLGALVMLEKPNWLVRGFDIDVQGHAAFAAVFAGDVTGSVLADSEIHHGKAGAGVSFHRAANGGTLENNHIHDFYIAPEDSHGVVVHPTEKKIIIRNNVIHRNSADGIQCYAPDGSVPAEPATHVLIEGNDIYGNYEQSVDIKTCHDVTVRRNRLHGNELRGNGAMVVHMSARNILIEENELYDSGVGIGVGGIRFGPMPTNVVIQRNRFHDMHTTGGWEGAGVHLENSEGAVILNNTFTRLPGPAITAGGGVEGPTSNLTVKNNLFDVATAVKVGSEAPGLRLDNNLYRPAATFRKSGTAMDFTKWKGLGFDANSVQADPQLDPATWVPGPAAIDRGERVDPGYCGAAPDIGAVETGC